MADFLELGAGPLTLEDVARVASGRERVQVVLGDEAAARIDAGRAVVEKALASGSAIYGVTTGFGRLSDVRVSPEDLEALQANLVRSHAAGVGPPLPREVVRAVILLRAHVLALGYSGVRRVVVERLLDLLNHGIHPVIPEYGSVGASGDLAPLAHLALVVMGEGQAERWGRELPGGEALQQAGLEPVRLGPKEGLALLNGTQVQCAAGILALLGAERALCAANVAGAMSLEALRGTPDAFDEAIQRVRPHPGQIAVAEHLRDLLRDSEIRESHRIGDPRVQDPYSIRCIPQVHGAALDALRFVRRTLEIEANSATDNPLVFPRDGRILSGGNFHGQPVAQALDLLAIAVADLASISQRRLALMLDPDLSGGLPPFLTPEAGLRSGLMIAEVSAAALVSEAKRLAVPASVDSIPTGANKEDHVAMGVHAAMKGLRALDLLEYVVAFELVAATQALEFLKPLRPGRGVEAACRAVREQVAPLDADRPPARDVERIVGLVRNGALVALSPAAPRADAPLRG
ncbi:MAG: histidine ammonia-lyase [Gemmatimonadetes bacterium]|nr:histidine ammonia-lyase [Gemmatimonadota bacterium]